MNAIDRITAIYDRIEAEPLNPVWISIVPRETALDRARTARGPLAGLPFAVKDNIDVAGLPTTAGCPAFAYEPEQSASVVRRAEDAGAVLIGKTNMDQFATGLVGTRTPYGACSSVFSTRYIFRWFEFRIGRGSCERISGLCPRHRHRGIGTRAGCLQ